MRWLVAMVLVVACGDSARDEEQDNVDRMIEERGGLYRDTEGRSFKLSGGKAQYIDARGGAVPDERLPPRFRKPVQPPPHKPLPPREPPVETDVTRGEEAEAIGEREKAATLYKRACAAKLAGGCAHLALMLKEGRGVEKDTTRAEKLAATACAANDGYGCFAVGILVETVAGKTGYRPVAEAIAAYDKGCTLKTTEACNALGMLYYAGRGVPKDPTKAASALERGCDLGDRMSCLQIDSVKQ